MNNRTFIGGLVVCLAVMFAAGGALFLLNHGHHRPEGVAEDWLTAVGDTSRKGVEADATRRADAIGPLELVDPRLVAADTDGKAAFADIEVSKAVLNGQNSARVAFRVHTRRGNDEVPVLGALDMRKAGDEWRVEAVDVVGDRLTDGVPAEQALAGLPELPSDGGPPPSAAPWSLWLGALLGAAAVGVVTTSLVRAAERGANAALATA